MLSAPPLQQEARLEVKRQVIWHDPTSSLSHSTLLSIALAIPDLQRASVLYMGVGANPWWMTLSSYQKKVKLRWIDRYIALISVIYISILYIYVIYVFWLRIVVSLTTTRDIESYAKKEKTGWYLVVPSIDRFFDVDSSPAIADSKEESDSSNKNIEFQFIQENENGNI